MDHVMQEFIIVLRRSGVRISTAESVDALKSVQLVGYEQRDVLKNSLEATLVKTVEEKPVFDKCFDLFFSADAYSIAGRNHLTKEDRANRDINVSPLSEMLLDGDHADLLNALKEAGQEAGLQDITAAIQQGLYARKIMEQLGLKGLEMDIAFFAEQQVPGGRRMFAALEESKKNLAQMVEDYVNQYYQLVHEKNNRSKNEESLKHTKFSNLDQRQIAEMMKIIQKLANKLYAKHSRRKKDNKKGVLDIRKTIRRNSAYQGYIFVPQWKYKKIDRPDLFVICDVSYSVQNISRFMLLFLYSLNRTLMKVRSFALCSNLAEVSHLFQKYPGELAIEKIYRTENIDLQMGPTDYGQAFHDFKEKHLSSVGNQSTIIILGDARNNDEIPRIELLRAMQEKCRTLIWLNPEVESMWGAGDSVMDEYRQYCDIAMECNTLHHLNQMMDRVLRMSRGGRR